MQLLEKQAFEETLNGFPRLEIRPRLLTGISDGFQFRDGYGNIEADFSPVTLTAHCQIRSSRDPRMWGDVRASLLGIESSFRQSQRSVFILLLGNLSTRYCLLDVP